MMPFALACCEPVFCPAAFFQPVGFDESPIHIDIDLIGEWTHAFLHITARLVFVVGAGHNTEPHALRIAVFLQQPDRLERAVGVLLATIA